MKDLFKWALDHCKANAAQSTCNRRHMACIIIDPDSTSILAEGYNGAPAKKESCDQKGWCLREELGIKSGSQYELCCGAHAENNALCKLGRNSKGCWLFLYGEDAQNGIPVTAPVPCFICTKQIINARIEKLYSWTGRTFIELDVDALYDYYIQEIVQKHSEL